MTSNTILSKSQSLSTDRVCTVPTEILPERSKSMSPESQCFLVLVKIRWESVFVHKVYPRKGWKSKQNCLRDMSSQENYILCEFCYHRKKNNHVLSESRVRKSYDREASSTARRKFQTASPSACDKKRARLGRLRRMQQASDSLVQQKVH